MDYTKILKNSPYALAAPEKNLLLTERLVDLTEFHYKRCPPYKRIMDTYGWNPKTINDYYDIPFLPVSLFKQIELCSVPKEEVLKIMTSSGTSRQAVSKIYCDRTTANNQQKTLVKIITNFTGRLRMPMLIIDTPSVLNNRNMFSARGAGILGFSIFGTDKTYILNDNMELNVGLLESFLEKHQRQRIFLFGFTFMVWQHFYRELVRLSTEGRHFDLSRGLLIHGGGWKKLISDAVAPAKFKKRLEEICGLHDIHDYYGMVEQTGCVYMECECGHLHASVFSDVITRRPRDFSKCDMGEPGIIQVVSMIPESYPGHSLLTEDEGVILGEDDCPCGRKGKYFKVNGRLQNAEIRGCSDTYAAMF